MNVKLQGSDRPLAISHRYAFVIDGIIHRGTVEHAQIDQ